MKKLVMWSGVAIGLTWALEVHAQPINFGNNAAVSQKSVRPMGKDEYAEEVEARWTRLKKNFSQRQREKDPFGSHMNPGLIKPIPQKIKKVIQSEVPVIPKIVSLQEAVDKFKPNLISEKRQEILYGPRTLKLGDPVQIEHDGVLFNLHIVKITATEVEFINTENQEKASAREKEFDPRNLKGDDSNLLQKFLEEKGPVRIK